MTDTKIPVYLLGAARPAEGTHEKDTINGFVYRFLAVRDGVPENINVALERYFENYEGITHPERVRWSWGNCGLVCRTIYDAEDFAARVLEDSPFAFMGTIR